MQSDARIAEAKSIADIIQFAPKADSKPQTNVCDFVSLCRYQLTIFGDVDWEDTWDISDAVSQRGRSGRIGLVWSNHDTSKTKTDADLMVAPFVDFARAYMRYQHGMRPTKNFNHRIAALRALERALSENCDAPDITKSDPTIFNRASSLIKEKYQSSTAYRVGGQLTLIADFINENGLVATRFSWKNPLKRDIDRNRVGKQFDEERSAKLPQSGALDAMAKVFHLASEPADIVISSAGALLVAAPDRINELFRLPADCEVERQDANGNMAYGIRWWPSKGADPYVKWIAPTMVNVAKDAIKKLRQVTDHARIVAQWYEANPDSMWLPTDYEYLRLEPVSLIADFKSALNLSLGAQASTWMKENNVPVQSIGGRIYARFSDVEAAVLKRLPDGFPNLDRETGLNYGDALFVVPKNTFHPRRSTYPSLIEKVNWGHISNGLGGGVVHGKSSIFTRMGLKADDGSNIKITTHQFRHWLNTIAQRGGLSQLDIAKWSGRKDVRQNEVYDHVTADEMIAMVRENDDGLLYGPFADAIKRMPLSREDFLQEMFPTAHTTEYGFCIHDFSMMPCQKHRDCINCTEHLCVKGERDKTQRIKATLEIVEEQLRKAEDAIQQGVAGADRWFEHHAQTTIRLRDLVDVLENPEVPVGSIIQLASLNEFSQIKRAVDDRKMIGDDDSDILNALRVLKGPSK